MRLGAKTKSLSTPEYKRLRQLLTEIRKRRGLTQAQVATRLGRHQSHVAKYESGERRLDLIEISWITDILDFDIHSLIDEVFGVSQERTLREDGIEYDTAPEETDDEREKDYITAFKREAVRLLAKSGKSADQFERDLGIGPGCLSRWKQELSEGD
jgi:transcriptional regulator with XRE-family HTH domain